MGIQREQGQGLVEYALILVLIAIAVVMAVSLLGTRLMTAYEQVTNALGGGAIRSATAARTGFGNGNDVVVSIVVDGTQTVTVRDSQSGKSSTVTCVETCSVTIGGVGFAAGTMTIEGPNGTATASYSAKK